MIYWEIEGEYVNDKTARAEYAEKNEAINRTIEISIVGRIEDDGKFKRGLSELPLIQINVYILKDTRCKKICIVKESEPVIKIGDIMLMRV